MLQRLILQSVTLHAERPSDTRYSILARSYPDMCCSSCGVGP